MADLFELPGFNTGLEPDLGSDIQFNPFFDPVSPLVDEVATVGAGDPILESLLNRKNQLASVYQGQLDEYNRKTTAAEEAQAGRGLTPSQGLASILIAALPALVGGMTSKTKAGKAAASGAGGAGVRTYLDLNEKQQKADLQRLLGLSKQNLQLLQRTQQDAINVDKQIAVIQDRKERDQNRADQRQLDRENQFAMRQMGIEAANAMRGTMSAYQAGLLAMQEKNFGERQRQNDRLESGKADALITETLGPVEAMGGYVAKLPSGAIPKISQKAIADVQRVKDASDKAAELANLLRPQYSDNGLTINLATEDGRVVYNKMRTDLQALFEEVAANSVYSKQGLRPDEIGRLLRRMPADPNEFNSFFKSPAVTFTKAEVATLDKLVEQLERTTKTEAKNRGIVFPNADGTLDREVIGPEDVFSYFSSSYKDKSVAESRPQATSQANPAQELLNELKSLRERNQQLKAR